MRVGMEAGMQRFFSILHPCSCNSAPAAVDEERACVHSFGFDKKKRDIAGMRSTKRLQVGYTLKNTASVYMITRQTRRTNQLFFNTTPAPGYGWGGNQE